MSKKDNSSVVLPINLTQSPIFTGGATYLLVPKNIAELLGVDKESCTQNDKLVEFSINRIIKKSSGR